MTSKLTTVWIRNSATDDWAVVGHTWQDNIPLPPPGHWPVVDCSGNYYGFHPIGDGKAKRLGETGS